MIITKKALSNILSNRKPPCISLYQPTHRNHPENQQDPILFRNLLKELQGSLKQKYPAIKSERLLEPFQALAENYDFWKNTYDGLAILAGVDFFHVMKLHDETPELAIVADTFHTKPLWRSFQTEGRFQVLGLSLSKMRFFEGNRHTLDEVDLPEGVPSNLEEALGKELTEPHQTVASYGGVGRDTSPMHHGHGGRKKEVDIDAERFFRAIDRAVIEHFSHPSGLPLILAALPEHHHLFHEVSKNPLLASKGIQFNPDSLSSKELRELAWDVFKPEYLKQLATLSEEFKQKQAKGMGSDDLIEVAKAAVSGRISTLLIDGDREIPGKIDHATGEVEFAELNHPEVDDLLDDLGEVVFNDGGKVLVLKADQMPTNTGLAAIYRY